MINSNLIKQLDSRNISTNPTVTKKRFESIWSNATNIKKNAAVSLGGYKDTRSFTNAKNSGLISVRMLVCLAITFDVDCFWLNAEIPTNSSCTEASVNKFLKKYGFERFCTYNNDSIMRQEMVDHVSDSLKDLSNDEFEKLSELSDEDYLTLLKSLLIKSKNKSLDVIKALLYL
ncbi:hypothetical protein [Clostridium estertheticum]|uniref:hypothetical protein n=1 Tax=Clostridium estertheticum TaxID=238834 RepID=UPI001CF3EB80|nr:hypothetical protein [Clostridium estertheticum]MCB2342498.1 hypothetical protein [Clostridium estertheticum]